MEKIVNSQKNISLSFALQIEPAIITLQINAKVAELVDALDLGSSRVTCESSSLSFRTISFTVCLISRLEAVLQKVIRSAYQTFIKNRCP